MPTATSPIGIFDSGVGGLTVARAVMEQLPHESVIYTGDTAHSPYGPRPISEVRAFSQDVADRLVERGCKMLVIACNTATAAFLHDARERYDIPIVEVIRPAVRRVGGTTVIEFPVGRRDVLSFASRPGATGAKARWPTPTSWKTRLTTPNTMSREKSIFST